MRKQGALSAAVEVLVPFHDVDLAGVVWHGHYMKYLENARWSLMDSIGFSLDAMIASGFLWPVVGLQVKYVRAARYGDRLRVQASIVEWESRLVLNYLLLDTKDNTRVGRAQTVQVAVEKETGTLQLVSPACLTERVLAALKLRGEMTNERMTGGAAERRQVVVVGAGPSGSIAAALLKRRGRDVLVLERQQFPRFSIGESLLVHCLDFVEEAGMLEAVQAAGFQYKNGAAFAWNGKYADYDFGERFTPGRPSTFQVQRARFDKILADEAEKQGVEIRYEVEITGVSEPSAAGTRTVTARSVKGGEPYTVEADFILDASGFGRTLPKLLNLETPSAFPTRQAIFTHVADHIPDGAFDRNKIRVTVHPERSDVWFWLIPFSEGRSSLGVVAAKEFLDRYPGPPDQKLRALVAEDRGLASLLADAEWDTPVRELHGYAANVKTMSGPGFALLGNAAEFLDPVFSSGVTIAMRSASMAVSVLDRQFKGETVNWKNDFEIPLRKGVDCFRTYVEAWYDGRFQSVVFHKGQTPDIRRMISSVLAGYAWDDTNPFVADPQRRLNSIVAWVGR